MSFFGCEKSYSFKYDEFIDLVSTSRDSLEEKIKNINPFIIIDAYSRGLPVDSIGFAILKAYLEVKDREEFLNKKREGKVW